MATVLTAFLAGCMTLQLDVPPPSLKTAAEAALGSRLLVLVESGAYQDTRSLHGFDIRVDGESRAWIENLGGRAEIGVTPGSHDITVSHAWRKVGILLGLPIPESGAVEARITVLCARGDICAVAFWPVIDRKSGLMIASRHVDRSELEQLRPDSK